MNLYRNRITAPIPFRIARLAMRRNRIMNHRLDAVVRQIALKAVSMGRGDGEDMPDMMENGLIV